jgi:hypothetical protein
LKEIELNNKLVFDSFLDIEKPIIAAINGPAVGASVTTASLCNAVSEFKDVMHTFHTLLTREIVRCTNTNMLLLFMFVSARSSQLILPLS